MNIICSEKIFKRKKEDEEESSTDHIHVLTFKLIGAYLGIFLVVSLVVFIFNSRSKVPCFSILIVISDHAKF